MSARGPARRPRFLAVSDSALGDLVSSTVVLSALTAHGSVDLITRPELEEICLLMDGVRSVSIEEARRADYDEVIDLTSSSRTRGWTKTFKAETKRGRADGWFHRLKAKWVYDVVVPKSPVGHIVRDYDPLLRAVEDQSIRLSLVPSRPRLRVPEHIQLPARLTAPKDFVAIHVGAGNPLRQLPETLVLNLVKRARAGGHPVVFVGTEAEAARNLIELADGYPVYEPLRLTQLALLLTRARRFIAPDSGPLHLAAALGARATGIYGPNLVVRAAPIAGPRLTFVEKDWPCRPCNQNRPCPYNIRCLRSIGAEEVEL